MPYKVEYVSEHEIDFFPLFGPQTNAVPFLLIIQATQAGMRKCFSSICTPIKKQLG